MASYRTDDKPEKVTDLQLIDSIDSAIRNSVGSYTNSSDLSRKRENSSYEFGLVADGLLAPNGVSSIVSSDTTEIIEGYTAILCDLLLSNNKLARFLPRSPLPEAIHLASVASDVVNHCIFTNNTDGWRTLETWIKSGLLYGNSIITWNWQEDYELEYEEYSEISQVKLDELLSDPEIELMGELYIDTEVLLQDGVVLSADESVMYKNVKVMRKVDRSGVKIRTVPPEAFRINRDATSISDSFFVGFSSDMTWSEVRKMYPNFDGDLSQLGEDIGTRGGNTSFSLEQEARQDISGVDNWANNTVDEPPDKSSTLVQVIECWIRTDRDGDGIAELTHVVKSGMDILSETKVSYVPVADFNPIEVPHEFYGLSMADVVRPQTLATTAILRGFIENTYLGNYGRLLADPNVVDFDALLNPTPKQVIATNGNPAAAVQHMQPEPISSGTAGILEFLGLQKEQATGLGKSAQGLNDALYVSGNSEAKVSQVQSAAMIRVEHIARRFVEAGLKDLCRGVYKEIRKNMQGDMSYRTGKGDYAFVKSSDLMKLPSNMDLDITANLGENSNKNMLDKLQQAGQIVQQLAQDPKSGHLISPMAGLNIASSLLGQMGLDASDYIIDPSSPEAKQAQESKAKADQAAQEKASQVEQMQQKMAMEQAQAQIDLTKAEAWNKAIDNSRQIYSAEENANVDWAKIEIEAAKNQVQVPARPAVEPPQPGGMPPYSPAPQGEAGGLQDLASQIPPELIEMAMQNPEQAMQMAQQAGIDPAMIQQLIGGQ